MNSVSIDRLQQVERTALGLGAVALLAAAVLGWREPAALVPAWRLAGFACLQPALGSLIFVLIYRLTGGQWAEGLAPFLVAGTRLLPWIWLLILPLVWFPVAAPTHRAAATAEPGRSASVERPAVSDRATPEAAPQSHAVATSAQVPGVDAASALRRVYESEPSRHFDAGLPLYFSKPLLATRAAIFAVAFFLLALGAVRVMRTPAADTMRWFGPVGLIGLVFLLHLLAVDWFLQLEPGWYSTGFPLVWVTAQALAGLAAAVCAVLGFGADPASIGGSGRARGLDWGNLLLASVMAWTYVAFVQFLIIWSGNRPAEIEWYEHRSHGIWHWILIVLALLEFGAPFLLLLSRFAKKRRRALASVAALLLCGQLLYTVWLIVPAFPAPSVTASWLRVALVAAALALFFNRYLASARSVLAAAPAS